MPWTADITKLAIPGKQVIITLEVDDTTDGLAAFIRGGGIQKDVSLLSAPDGKAITLFRASSSPWAKEMNTIGEITNGSHIPGWVTDGPYLFRTKTGKLGVIWSSWGTSRYALRVAYSTSGTLRGPWVHEAEPLVSNNSGHGMFFKTFEGKLLLCLHYQDNGKGRNPRKPMLLEVDDSGDKLKIGKRYEP